MFERLRAALVSFLSPPPKQSSNPSPQVGHAKAKRMYGLGRPGRLTAGFGTQTTSEDSELSSSLITARNRSRELVRDAGYAKRAKVIVQNNVVGPGIGMQAKVMTTREELNEAVNDELEDEWEEWCEPSSCHTGESLHFADLERMVMGEVFEAGEILVRMHRSKIGRSKVPLALEVIEPERIADAFQPSPALSENKVKLGVEVNRFGAPQAYWLRWLHPGELKLTAEETDKIERVPAADIIHLRIIERWPATRSMPWMHATGRKFQDMDGLSEAEITAARGAACYMGFIQSPEGDGFGEKQEDGTTTMELEPAVIERLKAGETFNLAAPNRPNAQLDPFMRMMLREVAAGTGCSYESLSRDYSQSNYSSSRLALLDDRDLWRMLQLWFIRGFRQRIHNLWLQQAVFAKVLTKIPTDAYAVNPRKYQKVRYKPRGWSWIDPTTEVEAYKEAIRAGFTTQTAVIAATADGRDIEDVLDEREHELELAKQYSGLIFDTDPSTVEKADNTTKKELADAAAEKAEDETDDDPLVKKAEKMLRNAGGRNGE